MADKGKFFTVWGIFGTVESLMGYRLKMEDSKDRAGGGWVHGGLKERMLSFFPLQYLNLREFLVGSLWHLI